MSIKIPMTWKCDPVPSKTQLVAAVGGKTFPTEEEAKEAVQSIGKSIAKGIVMEERWLSSLGWREMAPNGLG